MEVAYHFNADDPQFKGVYGRPILTSLFSTILASSDVHIQSQVSYGDLLHKRFSLVVEKTPEGEILRFDPEKLSRLMGRLFGDHDAMWSRFRLDNIPMLCFHNIYVVAFGNLGRRAAEYLDAAMAENRYYVGAFQFDRRYPLHNLLYEKSLVWKLRINGASAQILENDLDFNVAEIDTGLIEFLRNLGFTSVKRKIIHELT